MEPVEVVVVVGGPVVVEVEVVGFPVDEELLVELVVAPVELEVVVLVLVDGGGDDEGLTPVSCLQQ